MYIVLQYIDILQNRLLQMRAGHLPGWNLEKGTERLGNGWGIFTQRGILDQLTFFPQNCVGFLFPAKKCGVLVFESAPPGRFRLCVLHFTHNFVTHTHNLSHTTLSHTNCHKQLCRMQTVTYKLSQTTLSHTHTTLSHSTLSHTPLSHATLSHTTLSRTNCHIQLCHTQLCHTQIVTHKLSHTTLSHTNCHTQLCHIQIVTHILVTYKWSHTTLSHTTLSHNFVTCNFATYNLATSTLVSWNVWHLATSAVVSRGRRGAWWHPPSFCVAGVVLMRLGWLPLVTRLVPLWRRATLRSRRGAWRHPPSFHVAGVIHIGLGWFWWRSWSRCGAVLLCVAGVALGDIHRRFAWQASYLWDWAGSGDALGPAVAAALCVAGVALGDIHLGFTWQAWFLWDWAGSGDALGPAVTPRLFAWQAWRLATSTLV